MIDYMRRPAGFAESFDHYNRLYSENEAHFKIATLADDFLHRIVERIDGSPVSILETGCGQGEYVVRLADYLRKATVARGDLPQINVRGIDGSEVAIRQCSNSYPEHHWVCDSVQGFLRDHSSRFPGESYDVILDKGGIILFASEDETDAAAIVNRLRSLLKPKGFYAYYISTSFYDIKFRMQTAAWRRQWMEIVRDTFPSVEDLHVPKGAYRLICRNA